ncbi:MAG: hypothetical protein L6R37_005922 [Teloschistes peruensis]|nr:MAG: hypothetical protein L6R37_005922 [Teloschistes peruensis]
MSVQNERTRVGIWFCVRLKQAPKPRGLALTLSSTGNRLLVVSEDVVANEKYSVFWGDLESLGPALTPILLLDFIKNDGNILLTLSADSPAPSAISSLLLELDIQLSPDRTSLVVDHFNYDTNSASDKHDVLLLQQSSAERSDVRNYFGGDGVVAFPRAVAQELGSSSPLLTPVVRAPDTAYSYNPKEEAVTVEEPFAVGSQISLVSSLQARNSARFTILGSVEVLENAWFDAKVKAPGAKNIMTSNRNFAKHLSAWTFKETGVLKVGKVEHHLSSIEENSAGNGSIAQLGYLNPQIYRIKNDVTFNIELSERSFNGFSPFIVPPGDELQLEFTMLSPFHRLDLKPIATTLNSTIFGTTFRLPDQHGIFAFRVNYKRPFLTNIDVKREVTVRHFAHDEWPRSWQISAGWVWIAGIWVTVAGWMAFVAIWLWSEPAYERSAGKKLQ